MFHHISISPNQSLRLATHSDLPRVKALDDRAFAGAHGVSLDELASILDSGAIILLTDISGDKLVGESQLITRTIPGLPYSLSNGEAFYYGTGIDPDFQAMGYGKLLANAQDAFAAASGATASVLTVRAENYRSIKMRLDCGFRITDFDPFFYKEDGEEGARLIMRKALLKEVCEPEYAQTMKVRISLDGGIDKDARVLLAEMLGNGYQGYAIERTPDKKTAIFCLGRP